jgi:hypothetical protein
VYLNNLSILGKSQLLQNPALETTQEVPIDETRYFIRFVLNGKINTAQLTDAEPASEEGSAEGGGEESTENMFE